MVVLFVPPKFGWDPSSSLKGSLQCNIIFSQIIMIFFPSYSHSEKFLILLYLSIFTWTGKLLSVAGGLKNNNFLLKTVKYNHIMQPYATHFKTAYQIKHIKIFFQRVNVGTIRFLFQIGSLDKSKPSGLRS